MIFVNSISDLFHKGVPKAQAFRAVFDTMEKADWHTTFARAAQASLLMGKKFINERYRRAPLPPHMWFGVSVENERG